MYVALVVYASLYPFANWRDQGIAPWSFLSAPPPRYWSGFDVALNLLGYVPLGALLVFLMLRGTQRSAPVLIATLCAGLVSLLMEGLQSYLPQRVASREDWLLNTAGAAVGAALALALVRAGWLAWWDARQRRWLTSESRGVLALLLAWPAALLFPAAVPFGMGQVWNRLAELMDALLAWAGMVPGPTPALIGTALAPSSELACVALGLLVPCLLGFCVVQSVRHRVALVFLVSAVGFAATGLSAALSWGPAHTWAWLNPTAGAGAALAAVLAMALAPVSARVNASLALLALGLSVGLLNQAPDSPYFAQTLHAWEQGRFIRFHGFAQWLGWTWPYAAMGVALAHIARRGHRT
jgi:VanZ family protein